MKRLSRVITARPQFLAAIVLALGSLLSVFSAYLVWRAAISTLNAQFDSASENRVSAFARELESYEALVPVLQRATIGGMTETEFTDFAYSRLAGRSYDRWLWLTTDAADHDNWQVRRVVPSTFADQLQANREAWLTVARQASTARRTGRPVASAAIDIGGRNFTLLCTPIGPRRERVAVAAIDLGAALEHGMSYLKPYGIDVDILDPHGVPLYHHRSRRHEHPPERPCSDTWVHFQHRGNVRFAGQEWTVAGRSVPEFVAASMNSHAGWLAVGGGLISLLVAGIVYLLVTQTQRIRRLVDARTRALIQSNERLLQETRKRTETQLDLAAGEHRYKELFDSASDIVLTTDIAGSVTALNPAAEAVLGWTSAEARARSLRLLPPAAVENAIADGVHKVEELPLTSADGRGRTLEFTISRLTRDGANAGLLAIGRDVTSRRRLELFELGRQRILERIAQECELDELFRQLTLLVRSQLPQSISCVLLRRGTRLALAAGSDTAPFITAVNTIDIEADAAGSGAAAYWGKVAIVEATHDAPAGSESAEAFRAGYRACWSAPLIAGAGHVNGVFTVYREPAGPPDQYEHMLLDKAAQLAALAVERRQWTDSLMHQAQHDYLTGLPNRLLFRDRLQQAIARGRRNGTATALLYMDLDGFKLVNDTLGHPVGDRLLQAVARRLDERIRATDTLARMGGDEFTLIAGDLRETSAAEDLARDILDLFKSPFAVEGHELYVSASIGVAVAPRDGEDEDNLQRHADAALYCAKRNGKSTYRVFTPEADARVVDRLGLQTDLHHALEQQQFRLVYQPQVDLRGGQLLGFEALLRWEHPSLGVISPAKFIPIAEETGMILEIGAWVFREACRQLRQWQDEGLRVRVAVNVSALQFGQDGWEEMVRRTIAEFGVDPALLDLEVTESMVLSNIDDAAERMRRLRDIGVNLSIDDFGTGYSSLSYLRSLPVDKLKIDLSFVREIQDGKQSPAIVKAIIDLAAGLGLRVTAEGVETAYQMDVLRSLHCSEAQGYYFGKPASPEQARQLLGDYCAAPVL